MDFFEAQAAAHRTTLRLVALFIGAVLALIALTVALVAAVVAWTTPPTGLLSWEKFLYALSPQLVFGIAAAVIGLVAVASVFRLLSLSSGGRGVAEALGGRLLATNSDVPEERRLLNVVEEMAIASGLPVPPVYVLDEEGINAFAAGYGPDDAVIGVTRGTLELLDRSELQGVIGHEFSHVLNGDMRLNLRLTAVLFGILVIGIVGRSLVGRRSSGGRSSRGGSGTAQIAALAAGLMIIGYVGTFFGNLIKAAVSRQREFLADASAVQFTRNPVGIASALRKIGGHYAGSGLLAGRAEEMSHMFFGQAVSGLLGGLGATHPPLEARISAVYPAWDGSFLTPRPVADANTAAAATERDGLEAAVDALEILPAALAAGAATTASEVQTRLGRVSPDDVTQAQELIGGLPRVFHDAAHDPFGARAAIYALLVQDGDDGETALAHLDAHAEPGVPDLLRTLLEHRSALPAGSRITLVHLAMPALKALSEPQYARFRDNLVTLVKLDGGISRFEWILHQVVLKELRPHFEGVRRRRMGSTRIADAQEACWVLLSTLAHIDHAPEDAEDACRAGLRTLALEFVLARKGGLAPRQDRNQQRLTAAMRSLRGLHPLDQPRLLKAAIATVEHDGRVSAAEYELLAGVAAALDCPLPPLHPSP
ncbi:MAG: M48 family metallopeptidase [Pseudomonadales bacterium]|jgi:Zn-dependent protease with chaperone function|nr:M48 family metallopeptidase [Pseudomonadales bacterium]